MPDADILIVGGGPAGLTSAGALKKAGREAVVLEQDGRIGDSWRRRYERLRLHTVRRFSGLAHYPIPRHYGKYLPKDRYAQYLQDYARHFNLECVLNTRARKVRAASGRPGYRVETDGESWRARVVVIATGQFGRPVLPDWPGLSGYRGRLIHSSAYRTGRDFAGRRALVIGAGNSGAEIATDLAEQGAERVDLSVRTPPPVVPRDFLGTPAQVFGLLLSPLPPGLADRIASRLARLALGDLQRWGLPPAAWQPFSARRIPVIDVGLVEELRRGRITIRPDVDGFTREGARFKDGHEEAYDAVIAATGFHTGLDELLEAPGILDADGVPRALSGEPTSHPGLYFMGFVESHRGHLFEMNRASRRLARRIARHPGPSNQS